MTAAVLPLPADSTLDRMGSCGLKGRSLTGDLANLYPDIDEHLRLSLSGMLDSLLSEDALQQLTADATNFHQQPESAPQCPPSKLCGNSVTSGTVTTGGQMPCFEHTSTPTIGISGAGLAVVSGHDGSAPITMPIMASINSFNSHSSKSCESSDDKLGAIDAGESGCNSELPSAPAASAFAAGSSAVDGARSTSSKPKKAKKMVGRPISFKGDINSSHLTEEERRRIKRRVANRESARRVRQKRMESMEEMQIRMKDMQMQTLALMNRIQMSEAEKSVMSKQLLELQESSAKIVAQNAQLNVEVTNLRQQMQANLSILEPANQADSLQKTSVSWAAPGTLNRVVPDLRSACSIEVDEWMNGLEPLALEQLA